METKKWIILGGFVIALVLVTCCPEYEDLYPPEGTLRYWDEHDTIVFYSPEMDVFEMYPVCTRDYIGSATELDDRCNSFLQGYAAQYVMRKDSCENIEAFTVRVEPGETITVIRAYSDGTGDVDNIYTPNTNYDTLTIFGNTYKKVYQIEFSSPFDSLSAVYVTLEHGIIQYRYDDYTFNLVNDEI